MQTQKVKQQEELIDVPVTSFRRLFNCAGSVELF